MNVMKWFYSFIIQLIVWFWTITNYGQKLVNTQMPIAPVFFYINVKGAIMIHDCIYQFLRLFYHSRFKPQQLEMTLTQLSAPVLDLILVLPLILRLYKDFLRFSNARKLKIQSKSEVNRLRSLNFNEFELSRLFPKISGLSFCYTLISICHQYHLLREE